MAERKRVLIIGIEPTLIDFSSQEYAPFNLDAEKVAAGLKGAEAALQQYGYDVAMCLTDFGESAEAQVRDCLQQREYDCIVIGAGIRAVASNLLLFEKLINVVHSHAPKARICFNTKPTDTVEAIKRWL